MVDSSVAWEDFEQYVPAIETYLKITKQIGTLTQLELRLGSIRSTAQAAKLEGVG